jgi:predicted PurR-regulated permease PerM
MGKYEYIMVLFVIVVIFALVYVAAGPQISDLAGSLANAIPTPAAP